MPDTTPVTRSRLPVLAVVVWGAILVALVAVGLAFGGRGATTDTTNAQLGAGGAPGAAPLIANAPLAADPTPTPSASSGTGTNRKGPDRDAGKGPRGFLFGRGGQGFGAAGPGFNAGQGRGAISITAISGNSLSLRTDNGWTRTIDATGAKITELGGATIGVGDLRVGDHIVFREARNSDGTWTIKTIVRIPARAGGIVKSVSATSATLSRPDGTTVTIGLTAGTTYSLRGKAATAADLKVGTRVRATGTTDASGAFTATRIDIQPVSVTGRVTAKTADSITIAGRGGKAVTIHVTSSTTYKARGSKAASLADVATGNVVLAQGTLNADGSLNATDVLIGSFGRGGEPHLPFGGPGKGPNPGGPAKPGANPAPGGSAS